MCKTHGYSYGNSRSTGISEWKVEPPKLDSNLFIDSSRNGGVAFDNCLTRCLLLASDCLDVGAAHRSFNEVLLKGKLSIDILEPLHVDITIVVCKLLCLRCPSVLLSVELPEANLCLSDGAWGHRRR